VLKLQGVNARKLIRLLHKLGYRQDRQNGSHLVFKSIAPTDKNLTQVIIPLHNSKELPSKMVSKILKLVATENDIVYDEIIRML
jgi:predicted RNA binding protein YcfA (HicA-like mRNA interferase family)